MIVTKGHPRRSFSIQIIFETTVKTRFESKLIGGDTTHYHFSWLCDSNVFPSLCSLDDSPTW
jgi:hypothetical protein